MLDVHAPEHRIGGVRDFLVHLMTITAGLLIALGLEATVEAVDHRHERIEAEEKIRMELTGNRERLMKAQQTIESERHNMANVLRFIAAAGAGKPGDASGLSLQFSQGPLRDAAWRTASATEVLNYMDYDTVQRFASAYKEQQEFETLQGEALNDYLQMQSFVVTGFDPAHVSAADLQTALPIARQTLAHLGGMLDVLDGTMRAYDVALGAPER